MKIEFFNNVLTLIDLKKQYKVLAFKHHPDRGGDNSVMQKINSEYEFLMKKIINESDNSAYSEKSTWHSKEEHTEAELKVKAAFDKIVNLEGLIIEQIGTWLWVSGDTKPHKAALKDAGLKWNGKLEKWIFVGSPSRGRGTMAMDEIRAKYGSQIMKGQAKTKLIK
ncbi:molecular chaperone DnaJ [Acinetobacter baumannii]|uniref:molecular chaperone DnaJ n=1 Tax=Acinetobacter baumannii TaxID=470 RepID=UPI0023400B0E|nr:molecular chaperone DnaJ [Acinetobacter baumannii]MDC4147480.1 molecular chaperone DnaJ [Acinetobacter baumannii]